MRISDWSSDVCSSDLIVGLSIRQRWFVLAIVGLLCALGVWSAFRLPVDAVPDITNVQVQINTEAEGYSPLESEQRITFPIETAISGIPNLDYKIGRASCRERVYPYV